VIPRMIAASDRVIAFQHTGYWKSVETVHDYWQAHMDLLSEAPDLNLQDVVRPVRARSDTQPPTRISAKARVSDSMVCEGCSIEGTVEHSILSPGVHVAPGAVVRHAVVMAGATIEERAVVENAILGVGVVVGSQAHVGHIHRHAPTCRTLMLDPPIVTEHGRRISTWATVAPDLSGSDVPGLDSLDSGWLHPALHPHASTDAVFWTE
jgi:ADP-glucose pyrophosphorylase